jgi:hypothetical protein
MVELQTQARLVDPAAFTGAGVSVGIRRADIEEALAEAAYPAQLLLEIERAPGGGAERERGEVVVTWDERELNELLRSVGEDADGVTLWFEETALEQALADDVEAHGLRERTALFAIVVAAAGGSAGAAFAGGTGYVNSPGLTASEAASAYVNSPGLTASQDEATTTAAYVNSPGLTASQDEAATTAAYVNSPGLTASESGAASTAAYVNSPGLTASQDEAATTAAYVNSPGLTASETGAATSASASASDSAWSLTVGEGAGLAAGMLLITGAAFLTARSRRHDLRPT